MTKPTIALIHAYEASMGPATEAFGTEFPQAQLWQLLDNRLISDADRAGGLTPALRKRMATLISYAIDGGADAVQLSCSMYGPVATEVATSYAVPVVPSDDAMFAHVAEARPQRIGVLGSLESAAADSARRLRAYLAEGSVTADLDHGAVSGAAAAADRGDQAELESLLLEAGTELAHRVDVIVLAQYSIAPALPAMDDAISVPVLSPPHMAASALARTIGGT